MAAARATSTLENDLGAIGGAPADEALQALVAQFSTRSAFVRELIQNALDADAGRIDISLKQEGKQLRIAVSDDGAGMNREIIETALLVLFRSSKEGDLTRIGKFGIGFVSIFAVQPQMVVVDTARDGIHHRVLFGADRRYTLAEVEEPYDGTTVVLLVPLQGDEARLLAEEVRDAVSYWCGFSKADIRVEGKGPGWDWPSSRVTRAWGVDAPVHVELEEDGFRAVLGFCGSHARPVGYYNMGLTLLEANEAPIRGVTFRVESRLLAHTVTRDNVIRDRNWERVVQRLRDLAATQLRETWLAAIRDAVAQQDPTRLEALLDVAGPPYAELPNDLPCFPTVQGDVVPLTQLKRGFLPRTVDVLFATQKSPLALALAQRHVVLFDPEGGPAFQDLLPLVGRFRAVDVEEAFFRPEIVDTPPIVEAAARHGPHPLAAAVFRGGGRFLENRLAVMQAQPGDLERVSDRRARNGTLVIATDHPSFADFQAHPPEVGAALLLAAALRDSGDQNPFPLSLVTAIAAAGGAR